jgi:hypothetical protein
MGFQLIYKLPTHWNLIGRSMNAAASVVAQEYTSVAFVSLCSHPRKEKFGLRLKNVTISNF